MQQSSLLKQQKEKFRSDTSLSKSPLKTTQPNTQVERSPMPMQSPLSSSNRLMMSDLKSWQETSVKLPELNSKKGMGAEN